MNCIENRAMCVCVCVCVCWKLSDMHINKLKELLASYALFVIWFCVKTLHCYQHPQNGGTIAQIQNLSGTHANWWNTWGLVNNKPIHWEQSVADFSDETPLPLSLSLSLSLSFSLTHTSPHITTPFHLHTCLHPHYQTADLGWEERVSNKTKWNRLEN